MEVTQGIASTCLVLALVLITDTVSTEDGPVVETKYGQLRGTYLSIPKFDKRALSFLGVPYVAPPVGDLRFKPPQALEPWEGIKDVHEFGAPCPQMLEHMKYAISEAMGMQLQEPQPPSEDCLTLDVFTPSLANRRPVMVYIHGGGFVNGWSSMLDFRSYAIVENLVAVSIQYRLGALGWLSTGDGVVEGNMGFKDQVAALKWVQENIAQFGGDPDQVTIIGESAGGMSVSMHILSHASSGLFHRAVVQSGAVVDNFLFDPPVSSKASTLGLAKALGCTTEDMEKLVQCLREMPADVLADPTKSDTFDGGLPIFSFAPTKDMLCFPELPADLLRKGTFNRDVDVILGVTNVEGYLLGMTLNPRFKEPDFNMEDFHNAILGEMKARYPDSPPEVWSSLVDSALRVYSRAPEGDQMRYDFCNFFGDVLLTTSTFKLAVGLAEKSKGRTFFYEMRHRPAMSRRPAYIISDHADDLYYIAGSQYTGMVAESPSKFNEDDTKMAHMIMKYLSNFVRSGNPNDEDLINWPEFKGASGSYIVLKPQPVIEHNFKAGQMMFWTDTAPSFVAKNKAKVSSISGDGPVVEVKQGQLKGKVVTLKEESKSGFAFLNVPFAAPPVGELRFEPPQPAESWEGIRDATKFGIACPQIIGIMPMINENYDIELGDISETSEDCLHLNIYTSHLNGKRPVMVFIHGGGMTTGWASFYDMKAYAIMYNIVGVVIQYRLGVLGLLNSGDEYATGNQAFKDQIAALKWIQENIAQFGGDPDRVTIFGESAGSFSVSMHLMSPASKGLFHRGIMHSGSLMDCSFMTPPLDALSHLTKLANSVGCPNTSSEIMVGCLRTKPASLLINPMSSIGFEFDPENTALFAPTKGDGYIPDVSPDSIYLNTDVDLIAGVCNVEGFMLAKALAPGLLEPDYNLTQFKTAVTGVLGMINPTLEGLGQIVDDTTEFYTKGIQEGEELIMAMSKLVGDFMIAGSTMKTAITTSDKSTKNVYAYEFSERPTIAKRPDYIITDHGDDIFCMFGYSYMSEVGDQPYQVPVDENFRKVEDMMMTYWANFAATGNPNGDGLLEWPLLKDNKAYMVLSHDPHVGHNYEPERMEFWFKTLPKMAYPNAKTKDEL